MKILFILLMFNGFDKSMAAAEFESKASCEAAKVWFVELKNANYANYAECFKK